MQIVNKEAVIISVIGIAFVAIMGVLIWKSPQLSGTPATVDMSVLVKDTSHMTGVKTAKVTVVEFGDYECPFCGTEHPVLKQLIDAYKANANFNFVFRNYPLPQHPNALIAAEAAEAAGAQGKFWEMHDALYEHQGDWGEKSAPLSFFEIYAKTIGLDVTKFTADVNKNAYSDIIQADQADGNKAAINATPTIYINGVMQQNLDLVSLKKVVDADLAK